jgi:hypothetical protein
MSLDQEIANFLQTTDTGTGRSKLEPYAELIRGLRQRRWTYVKIADALRTRFGVVVAPSTVFAFVKVRACGKAGFALPPPVTPPGVQLATGALRPRFKIDV